jgi:hypothetical protein
MNKDNLCPDLEGYFYVADQQVLPLISAAPAMWAMLKELEWSHYLEGVADLCPLCGAWNEPRKHDPDCKLAALLAKTARPATISREV